MSKANFYVDSDFPVIDGVGHSDKQGYFNVKGGGSTNTTFLDALPPGQHLTWGWFDRAAIAPWQNSAGEITFPPAVDPSRAATGPGVVSSPGCLNGLLQGDGYRDRCGDSVLLSRITVNGAVSRYGGVWHNADNPVRVGGLDDQFPPKCFLALVADLDPNGAAFNPDIVFDPAQAYSVVQGGGSVPWLDHNWTHRFRVLAHDIIDFTDVPPLAVNLTNQFALDGAFWFRVESVTSYVHRPVTKGFRFDVDLNDVLCKYAGNTGTFSDLTNFGLHFCAVWFDGFSNTAYTLDASQNLGLEYMYRLWFKDFLSPSAFSPAGVDGPVLPSEAPDLDVLADQSAILAGDAPEPRRKKTKASVGMFNFRPRGDPALLSFPDDFEFSRLHSGKRTNSRPGRGRKLRRVFDEPDFDGEEMEPPPRRGKY